MDVLPIWPNKKKFKNKVLPDNFRLLIIGSSGCGKNVLLMRMLLVPEFLDYDNLLFYSTTIQQFEIQLLKHGFENKLSKQDLLYIYNHHSIIPDYIDTPLEIIKWFIKKQYIVPSVKQEIEITLSSKSGDLIYCDALPKDRKNLIIFDDVVNEKNQNIQKSYFTRGRHNNCNVIYISQTYYQLDKNSIRGNANCFVFFKLGKSDRDHVYPDLFYGIFEDKVEFTQTVTQHWKTKYNYFYLDKENETMTDDLFT